MKKRYGARVYKLDKRILIKQTVLSEELGEYVVDTDSKGQHKEIIVKSTDDAGLADAIRRALVGGL